MLMSMTATTKAPTMPAMIPSRVVLIAATIAKVAMVEKNCTLGLSGAAAKLPPRNANDAMLATSGCRRRASSTSRLAAPKTAATNRSRWSDNASPAATATAPTMRNASRT